MSNSITGKRAGFGAVWCLLIFCAGFVFSVSGYCENKTGGDEILEMLPSETIFCVRINNLDYTLASIDQYLQGVSPMGVTMLIKMQMASILGDPMLKNIDTGGSFVFFGVPVPSQPSGEMVLMAPVTDYNELVGGNPNISAVGPDGISDIKSPGSPLGETIMTASPCGKFAIFSGKSFRKQLLELKGTLGSQKSLMGDLLAGEQKEAKEMPIWCYVNMVMIEESYGPIIFQQLNAMQEAASSQLGGEAKMKEDVSRIFGIYATVLENIIKQSRNVTASLVPSAQSVSLSYTLRARDNTTMAKWLVRDASTKSDFELVSYLRKPEAVNFAMKTNKHLFRNINEGFFELLESNFSDKAGAEQVKNWKSTSVDWLKVMGDETAGSFSYVAGMPPVSYKQIMTVSSAKKINDLMMQAKPMIDQMYRLMGLDASYEYNQEKENYRNAKISSAVLKFELSGGEDPNSETAKANKIIKDLYGDGFEYKIATLDDFMLMTMSPKSDEDIRGLVDVLRDEKGSEATGDIALAMRLIEDAGDKDFVGSVNYLRLLGGLGAVSGNLGDLSGSGIGGIFAAFEEMGDYSQSALAFGGQIDKGAIGFDIVLPKQHLLEIMTAFQQLQQSVIKDQMSQQQQQNKQISADDPLASLRGKAVPSWEMKDVDGNVISLDKLKGKRVLLNFWATWCPPCKEEVPHLIRVRREVSSDELVMIGVSDEPGDLVEEFGEKYDVNFSLVSHPGKFPAPFDKVMGLPTTFYIDKNGTIENVTVGYYPYETIKQNAVGGQ